MRTTKRLVLFVLLGLLSPLIWNGNIIYAQTGVCFLSASDSASMKALSPVFIISADFNGDGKADLAVANDNESNISIFHGIGTGNFNPAVNIKADVDPVSLTSGDFNEDGRIDLAAANFGSDNMSVLINNGSGFNPAVNFSVGVNPSSITSTDFNNDGNLDLAVASYRSDRISVFLGNGLGSFAAPINFTVNPYPRSIVSTDLNKDGKADLAVAYFNSSLLSVLLGDGLGSFATPTNFSVGNNPYAVISGDFNADTNPDLAVANYSNGNVSVLLGDGLGSLGTASNFTVGVNPQSIISADFNGDSKLDLATANYSSMSMSVLIGNGLGSFGTASKYMAGAGASSLINNDFNGDGKTDVAVANTSGSISLFKGNGTGGFVQATYYGTGTNPQAIVSADFNIDGKADIATANVGSDNISVLLANGGLSTPIDFAGDDPQSLTVADFNADGKPDVAMVTLGNNRVSILLGNGNGGFLLHAFYGVQSDPYSVSSSDFNGDGKADLVVANNGSNTISVLLGDGTGSFPTTVTHYPVGSSPTSVITGFYNGDNFADIAVTNYGSNNISILLGDGTGNFSAAVNYNAGSGPYSLTNINFNSDNYMDLAVANLDNNMVSLLSGDGAGAFTASTSNISTASLPRGIISNDFNLDGKTDLAVASYGTNSVIVYTGDGAGNFTTNPPSFLVGSEPTSLASADFNADGKPDLAVSNSGSNDVSILLNNTATILAAGPTDICSGQSVTLKANNNGYAYLWNAPSPNTDSLLVVSTSGNYNVTITNKSGTCSSTSKDITITVKPLPAQPGNFTTSTATVCQGTNNVNYEIPNDPAVTYNWSYSGTGATINGSTNTINVNFAGNATSGTLSVTAVSNGCSSIARTMDITVNPLPAQPAAFTASTATVCQGTSNVNYEVPNDPAVTYSWSYSGSDVTINGTTNSVNLDFSATATSGTLKVTAISNGCSSTSRTMDITVNPLPAQPAAFTASTTTVCQGASNVNYEVPNDPAVTYNWSYSGTGATISGSTNTISVNFAANATSGILSVTATSASCISAARTLDITVNPLPAQPSAITGATAVCQGTGNVTYSVTNDPAVTYNWSYSGTGANINGSTNAIAIDFSASATSGTLSVTATNAGCTSTPSTVGITVNTPPAQPSVITASATTVCQGSSNVTYSVTNDPAVTYNWSYSGTGANIAGSTNAVNVDFATNATSGTLSVTATNAGCTSAPSTVGITVNPLPAQPSAITASATTVCQGTSNVTYSITNDPAVTYNWSYSGTAATINGSTNTITMDFSASATGGTLSVTATNAGCTSTPSTVGITVNPLPAQPGAFTTSKSPVCRNDMAVSYAVPHDPAVTYNWSYSGADVTINGSSNTVTLDFGAASTSGTLAVTATSGGCTSSASTFSITVEVCVGIDAAANALAVKVYPNPSNGQLFISNLKTNDIIQLFNNLGELVLETKASEKLSSLNIESIHSGIYFLRVLNSKGFLYHTKITIEK